MIQVENLTKVYGGDHVVVDHTSWTAEDGQVTGFIGPNGSGKTTTLKMITGILQPTEGHALLDGLDVAQDPIEVKQNYGYVSDSPDRFLRLKGIEYLNFIGDIYHVAPSARTSFIESHAARFGILDALNSRILAYSHGMRQKLMILGALIHEPSVWLLDEPLTGLDPQSAFELKKMMREHASKGHSVLFSTHVLEVAEKLCDKVIIIEKGIKRFEGSLDALRAQNPGLNSLEDIFLKIVGNHPAASQPAEGGLR